MAKLIGMDKVVRNLANAIKKIENGTQAGVLAAALHERGEAQKLAPVDEGNLKNSAYVVSEVIKGQEGGFIGDDAGKLTSGYNKAVSKAQTETKISLIPMAIIGFSAYYAIHVHEINKNYNVGQWKYLETVLLRDRQLILDTIRRKAAV